MPTVCVVFFFFERFLPLPDTTKDYTLEQLCRESVHSLSLMPGACRMENRKYRDLQSEEQRKESRKWHDKREYFFVQAILGDQSVRVRNGCRAFAYENRQDKNVFW